MPPTTETTLPAEFASTMQQLVAEAAKKIAPSQLAAITDRQAQIEAERAGFFALEERIGELEGRMTNGNSELGSQLQRIDDHLRAIRNTESVNQRLFNSLHAELKSYRDNFLRDSLQKPFLRDLIVLFDDLTNLAAQLETSSTGSSASAQWAANLQNAIHSLVEVLHRMEVTEMEVKETVDRTLHRVVSYEPTDIPEEDGRIIMRVKRGFIWHDQVLRPEEVVAKRFG